MDKKLVLSFENIDIPEKLSLTINDIKNKIYQSSQFIYGVKNNNINIINNNKNKVIGILNKLTKNNYNFIINELNFHINSEINEICEIIIKKAINDYTVNLYKNINDANIKLICQLISDIILFRYEWKDDKKTFRDCMLEKIYFNLKHFNDINKKESIGLIILISYLYIYNIIANEQLNILINLLIQSNEEIHSEMLIVMLYIVKDKKNIYCHLDSIRKKIKTNKRLSIIIDILFDKENKTIHYQDENNDEIRNDEIYNKLENSLYNKTFEEFEEDLMNSITNNGKTKLIKFLDLLVKNEKEILIDIPNFKISAIKKLFN